MNQITRLSLVDRSDADLSIVAQCRLLQVARSTLYDRAAPVSADDLRLMRCLDEQYLATPFYGSRRMVAVLRRSGEVVNRKRVRRLMRLMGLEAIYQKPNTSRRHPEHKVYPYLLRDLLIDRPNQVWCADITYIPLAKGFVYLVAVMDWFSRRVLAWRLSIGLDMAFCVEALQDAMDRYGQPGIFNTDQGVQFTSGDFIDELAARGVRISMDGKGRFLDNIFIERLWRSLNMRRCSSRRTPRLVRHVAVSAGGWPFTTMCVCTKRSVIERRAKCSRPRRSVDMWTTPAR